MAELNKVITIKTTREAERAFINDFVYNKEGTRKDPTLIFFVCDKTRSLGCKARLHVRGNNVVNTPALHNHSPDRTQNKSFNLIKAVKEEPDDIQETAIAILAGKTTNIAASEAAQLPSANQQTLYIKQEIPDQSQQLCPAPEITDVGQPAAVRDTDQLVIAVESIDERQNSIQPSDAVEVCVLGPSDFGVTQGGLRLLDKEVRRKHQILRRDLTVNSVGLVTHSDSMAPDSKVSKSDANVKLKIKNRNKKPQPIKLTTQKDPNHQEDVMSNLWSIWKAGQFCDIMISNGSTDIKVHKMVLGAVCPKLLPVLENITGSLIPKLTFPNSITKGGLFAFAVYMYSGVLDLKKNILVQLRSIAQILNMKHLEQLCNNGLDKSYNIVYPQVAKPCSLCGLLPSSTQRIPIPIIIKSENSSSNKNKYNSQRVVPTDNQATVGGPSTSSVPTPRSSTANIIASQVIDIKTEVESDDETLSSPNSESSSPFRDRYGIQEQLFTNFENITSNPGVGLQLTPPSANSGLVNIHSKMDTNTDLSPTTSNSVPTQRSSTANLITSQVIDIKTEVESDDETLSNPNSESSSPFRDRYGIQEQLFTNFENITSNPGVGLQLTPPSANSGLVNIHSNMDTNTDLSPTTSNSVLTPRSSTANIIASQVIDIKTEVESDDETLSPTTSNSSPYPVGLFTADGIRFG